LQRLFYMSMDGNFFGGVGGFNGAFFLGFFTVVRFLYGAFIYHVIFDVFPFSSTHLVHQLNPTYL
jgi:hypothetical protein